MRKGASRSSSTLPLTMRAGYVVRGLACPVSKRLTTGMRYGPLSARPVCTSYWEPRQGQVTTCPSSVLSESEPPMCPHRGSSA
jgi:hypothetical protein